MTAMAVALMGVAITTVSMATADDAAPAVGKADAAADLPYAVPYVTVGQEMLDATCSPDSYGAQCTGVRVAMNRFFDTLEGFAAPFTLTMPFLDSLVEDLEAQSGLHRDKLKYVLCLIAAYPLGFLFSLMSNPTVKHVFSLSVGFYLAQWVFGAAWIHSFVTSIVVYAFLALSKRWMAINGYRHFAVLIFMMSYMSVSHINRVVSDYLGWSLDYTGPQMLLTIKLSTLAFNLHDGTTDRARDERRAAMKVPDTSATSSAAEVREAKRIKIEKKVSQERLAAAIDDLPSLLEYFSWVYCFQNFFAGPAFEIREFLDAVDGSIYKSKSNPDGALPAGRIYWGLRQFVLSLVFMGLFVVGTGKFDVHALRDPAVVGAAPWWERLPVAWITLFFVRTQYYFAWIMAEGSAVIMGLGYDRKADKDGNAWGGANNIDILGFETAMNTQKASHAWNRFTQRWLMNYVYKRTDGSLAATYFTSAFWHGFYPGYYLFFMSVPIATEAERLSKQKLRPRFIGTSMENVYHVVTWLTTSLTMNYLATSFQVLALDYSLFTWRSWGYAGHIAMIASVIVLKFVLGKPGKPKSG